jgi:hypothetical protein
MKLERSQEIYSDYLENDLSPAMKLAMEQHLESDTSARKDFDDFARMFDMLQVYAEDVEPPLGFRAKVMELATIEDAKRRANVGFVGSLRNFFLQPRRREATMVLAGVVAIAVVAGVFLKPIPQDASNTVASNISSGQAGVPAAGSSAPVNAGGLGLPTAMAPEAGAPTQVITGVSVHTGSDGTFYDDIGVQLPDSIKHATIEAYSIAATQQILDRELRERDATPLLSAGGGLSGGTSLSIPVPLVQQEPAGATLNVLVEWQTDQADVPSGAQVVFTPMNPGDGPTPLTAPPANGNFFDWLQLIASDCHVTVIADTAAPLTTSVPVWQSTDSALTALDAVAGPAGYDVKQLSPDTYFVYRAAAAR